MQVGTLFNTKIAEAMSIAAQQHERIEDAGIESGPEAMAKQAREQSRILAALPTEERSKILLRIADALESELDEVLAANEKDIAAATGRIDNHMLQRLVLKPSKVTQLAEGIRQLANMEEPIGNLLAKTELAQVRPPCARHLRGPRGAYVPACCSRLVARLPGAAPPFSHRR